MEHAVRSTSEDLAVHLGGEVTSLATCWTVRRRDGFLLGFTTHDRPVTFDGVLCQPASAFTPSAIAASNAFNVDELEVAGVLSSAAIAEADLRAGLYDFAEVTVALVNWAAPEQGALQLKRGWIGEVTFRGSAFTAEIRGLTQALQQTFGEIYSPECRADLGDARCRVDLPALAVQATVAAAANAHAFTASALGRPDGWFAYGKLRWLSGANAGAVMEIRSHTGDDLELYDAMAAPIAPGDLFMAYPGCDKRFATCGAKFDNRLNFRGEPHVPGTDALLDYPGLR